MASERTGGLDEKAARKMRRKYLPIGTKTRRFGGGVGPNTCQLTNYTPIKPSVTLRRQRINMGFQDKLRKHADKLARKSPEEITPEIGREELEKLMRLKRLADAANKYLESIDIRQNSDKRSPMQSADN